MNLKFIEKYNSKHLSTFLIITYLIWIINFFHLAQQVNIQKQLFHLIIIFGTYITSRKLFKIYKFEPNYNSSVTATLINLAVFFRSLWVSNYDDKFSFFVSPLLFISLILFNYSFKRVKSFWKPITIIFSFPLYGILNTPLALSLIPLTSFTTWLSLFSLGLGTNIRNINELILENRGIVIDIGCAGSDMIIFSLITTLIYYFVNPILNKKYLLIVFFINTLIPLFLNIIRLSILGFSILEWDNKIVFDFFHESYGSLFFSLLATILASEIYNFFLQKFNPQQSEKK